MTLTWAFVAIADGIYAVAITAVLYGSIPEEGVRPAYFAIYNVAILGSFAIGGVLAVPLLPLLQQIDWSWSVFNLGGYHRKVTALLVDREIELIVARFDPVGR